VGVCEGLFGQREVSISSSVACISTIEEPTAYTKRVRIGVAG
jgi:hypothetical protein